MQVEPSGLHHQAPAGSTIRIARENVNQGATISKSLTLTRAPGATPTLGGSPVRTLLVESSSQGPVRVKLNRLEGGADGDTLFARDGIKGNDKLFGGGGGDNCAADPQDVKRSC